MKLIVDDRYANCIQDASVAIAKLRSLYYSYLESSLKVFLSRIGLHDSDCKS